MASNIDKEAKKAASKASALDIYRRLMALKEATGDGRSNNKWATEAGVNTSFFTNIGAGTKEPSDPAVNNLRLILDAINSSLPEFFLHEAQGRVVAAPTRQALEKAFVEALPDLPRNADARASYLASTVLQLLGLPENRPAKFDKSDGSEAVAP